WVRSTILSILKNEKYKGDVLLQKYYRFDFLEKKNKKNKGELPQYYVEDHHESIISSEIFNAVQELIQARTGTHYTGKNIYASKLYCKICGSRIGLKKFHANTSYEKIGFHCNNKYTSKKCPSPIVYERDIKDTFIEEINRLYINKEEIIKNLELVVSKLCVTDDLETKLNDNSKYLQYLENGVKELIFENSVKVQNQDEYREKGDVLLSKYNEAAETQKEIAHQLELVKQKKKAFEFYIKELKTHKFVLDSFDPWVWALFVDKVHISEKIEIVFKF
ncbi:MAG: recombinase family protein, partial [Clostridiales bacterium]|nr:recombinase family protein [Clostridiales bacterium]